MACPISTARRWRANPAADLAALMEAIKRDRPALVIIDTLAASMPGLDENQSSAMSRVVAVGRSIARHRAAVILVRHGTKAEGNTSRGHSLFSGALDMALRLKAKDGDGVIRGTLTK